MNWKLYSARVEAWSRCKEYSLNRIELELKRDVGVAGTSLTVLRISS
jgi:hypothetical protein